MSVSVSGTAGGVTVTASASTHTKGSYTQAIASTSIAADALLLTVTGMNDGADRRYLFDVATGGAGSEVVLLPNLFAACVTYGAPLVHQMLIPVSVAAGTRIALRCQSNVGSGSIFVAVHVLNGEAATLYKLGSAVAATYGADTANSRGTTIDPGGSANTKGSYSQITAATSSTNNAKWMIVHLAQVGNVSPSTANYQIDIATGGAGSEAVAWPDLPGAARISVPGFWPQTYILPVDIPTGTRIAVRAQCDITDATDRVFDVALTLIEGTLASGSGGGLSWAPISVVGAALGGALWRAVASGGGGRS